MKLSEYLHVVCGARSLEELWHAHVAQMAEFEFDRLIYGYTRYKTETSLGDPDDFVILSNHSSEYLNGFLHKGLYSSAPMLRWALENEGAGSWRLIQKMLEDGKLGPESERMVEFNKKMNMQAGYTVSFYSTSARFKGAISLGARCDLSQDDVEAIWQDHGEEIVLMNNVVHLKILTLPYAPPNRGLTKRQKEALQWVGDGKTTQDIALLMGLTPATVEKHLRLARDALAVETTAQAVLKAALQNQMYVMET
ncbi:autoinducer binding domain-containing protein [Phaeobacter sp. QD34_3]|uniref:autoinducer binding domain-containing protein n=1 Tax=unclassified Phaeobacter TaxID=2621772 RepID=UPI00237F61D2|nr:MULTISPECIES: autoinducer binding domain-containing protein [unclassified Phaeobacter]MDE4132235.1 autoinducer binding domain-containing protein [Phaeobacter sp. QD34_3]MDE4135873.1 autoinducer binding domain-containing protein [Phaeobacter sp. QD34_24]